MTTTGSTQQGLGTIIPTELFEPVDFGHIQPNFVSQVSNYSRKYLDFVNTVMNDLPPGPAREQVIYHLKQAQLWSQDSILHQSTNRR